MNWDGVSFDWNHIRAFLATAESGSLSGAARALRQSQPTLSRQIAALEEALDLTLFERTTRSLFLTEAGHELLDHVRAMGDAANQISRVAMGQSQSTSGVVRLTCSDALATYVLPRIIVELQLTHPGIRIDLRPGAEVADLLKRDADISIRHAEPTQPDLVAQRISDLEIGFFAAKSYISEFDGPLTLQSAQDANFIAFGEAAGLLPQLNAMGVAIDEDHITTTTTCGPALLELARAGAGITLLPTSVTVLHEDFQQVFPEVPTFRMPTWLVTHREIHTSRRIRVTFDHLKTAFRGADIVASGATR